MQGDLRAPFLALEEKDPETIFQGIPTPAYVIDTEKLRENGKILKRITKETGAGILLAQKAFSNYDFYPVLSPFLTGTEASGLYEARLGAEKMPGKEVHVFSPAYQKDEFVNILSYADHIIFNSVSQLEAFGPLAKVCGKSLGLRINPRCRTQTGPDLYDPCAPGSRLGVTRAAFDGQMTEELFALLDGFHFHTLCEQDADALEITLNKVDQCFGDQIRKMKWINLGGGQWITEPSYQMETLFRCIWYAEDIWKIRVYLEPGEAVAHNAGFLLSRILDIVENDGIRTAILDASPCCHMPDVLEMPYTPPLYGSGSGMYRYRLSGPTCLAGDLVGDYSFPHPLKTGDLLVLGDMAVYTTCKNNTFNGMRLPDIWAWEDRKKMRQLTHFGFDDFRFRLGSRDQN